MVQLLGTEAPHTPACCLIHIWVGIPVLVLFAAAQNGTSASETTFPGEWWPTPLKPLQAVAVLMLDIPSLTLGHAGASLLGRQHSTGLLVSCPSSVPEVAQGGSPHLPCFLVQAFSQPCGLAVLQGVLWEDLPPSHGALLQRTWSQPQLQAIPRSSCEGSAAVGFPGFPEGVSSFKKKKILVPSSLPPEPFLFISSSLQILFSSGSALFPLLSEFFISFTKFVNSEFICLFGLLVGWLVLEFKSL